MGVTESLRVLFGAQRGQDDAAHQFLDVGGGDPFGAGDDRGQVRVARAIAPARPSDVDRSKSSFKMIPQRSSSPEVHGPTGPLVMYA
jgi:hypothetical protein